MQFLFIDPKEALLNKVKDAFILEKNDLKICTCLDFSDGISVFEKKNSLFTLIAIDISVDDESLTQMVARFRRQTDSPIIVISDFAEEERVISIYKSGADYVIRKPVAINILKALFEAHLRRTILYPDFDEEIRYAGRMIFHGGLEIYPRGKFVLCNGVDAKLTTKEFDLLYYMARHADVVLTPEQISESVWGCKIHNNNSIYSYISRLRRKIEADPDNPKYILTTHRYGYLFRAKR